MQINNDKVFPQINPILQQGSPEILSGEVSKLMSLTDKDWEVRSTEELNSKMTKYCQECVPPGKTAEMRGFIEKHDLPPNSEVAVIGDIHGNDTRLDLSLKTLQQRGFLDESFRCKPGKSIVFLGDYVDRGKNSLKVLELVMTLKMENKDQVFLIRGNHEDLQTSYGRIDHYASKDPKYWQYMQIASNLEHLSAFYESLPVGVYLAQKPSDESNLPQYIHFGHGLFHLYTDPAPLFSSDKPNNHLWVNGSAGFSERIKSLLEKDSSEIPKSKYQIKQQEAALKLKNLESLIYVNFDNIYWLDAGNKLEYNPYLRRTTIDPQSIKAYLNISGADIAKVKEIIRGHQIGLWTVIDNQKIVATTIDPSYIEDRQIYMELKVSDKVRDWQKSLITVPLLNNHNDALDNVTVTEGILPSI